MKHRIRRPLGWRTRGQATLEPGVRNPANPDLDVVLAKSSIYTASALDSAALQNDFIVDLFFKRAPDQVIRISSKTGIRDMIEHDADLVEKRVTKRLNMEYDWKRCPYAVGTSSKDQHLVFNTAPWECIEDFDTVRTLWEEFQSRDPACLKTDGDFRKFESFVQAAASMPTKHRKYLRSKGKVSPGLSRLRMALCRAWKHGEAGFEGIDRTNLSDRQFAQVLTDAGIPCERSHVEYGLRCPFERHSCPGIADCVAPLTRLTKVFPSLRKEEFLLNINNHHFFAARTAASCTFVDRTCAPELDRAA
jgi:hypothetical protein